MMAKEFNREVPDHFTTVKLCDGITVAEWVADRWGGKWPMELWEKKYTDDGKHYWLMTLVPDPTAKTKDPTAG